MSIILFIYTYTVNITSILDEGNIIFVKHSKQQPGCDQPERY